MYHPILSVPTKQRKERQNAGMSIEQMVKYSLIPEHLIKEYEENDSIFVEEENEAIVWLHAQAIRDFKKNCVK